MQNVINENNAIENCVNFCQKKTSATWKLPLGSDQICRPKVNSNINPIEIGYNNVDFAAHSGTQLVISIQIVSVLTTPFLWQIYSQISTVYWNKQKFIFDKTSKDQKPVRQIRTSVGCPIERARFPTASISPNRRGTATDCDEPLGSLYKKRVFGDALYLILLEPLQICTSQNFRYWTERTSRGMWK